MPDLMEMLKTDTLLAESSGHWSAVSLRAALSEIGRLKADADLWRSRYESEERNHATAVRRWTASVRKG